jgi:DNA-binding Lrp family transcriptional regulator
LGSRIIGRSPDLLFFVSTIPSQTQTPLNLLSLILFSTNRRQIIFKGRTVTETPVIKVNGMAKTSRKQIDLDEKRIMAELEKNSNESLDVLAKRLKFSRQKIWRIIKGLNKSGVIWGYTTVVDNEMRSLKSYVLMLKRSSKPMDEKTLDAFVSLTSSTGASIESMFYMHGEYDWILSFTAPDIKMAKRFCETILTTYPGVFAQVSLLETLVSVRKHHVANPNVKKLKEFL